MGAQVAFVALEGNPQHYRQVERLAAYMGAPILTEPVDGAANVFTDGPDCWAPVESRPSIQIAHGVADKGNWGEGFFCEHVLAPSAFLAGRVEQGAPHVAGIPFLDPAFDGTLTPAPPGPRPRVLYAPTLSQLSNGTELGYSSRMFAAKIKRRLSPFDVTFSDHPIHSRAGVTPIQAYLDADVIVADYGSTLSLAIALGRPVVMAPTLDGPTPGSIEERLAATVRHARLATLTRLVAEAAENGPTPAEQDASEIVLAHEHRGTSTALAAEVIEGLAA